MSVGSIALVISRDQNVETSNNINTTPTTADLQAAAKRDNMLSNYSTP